MIAQGSKPAARRATIVIRNFRAEDMTVVLALMRHVFKKAAIDACIEACLGGTPWHRVKNALVQRQVAENPSGCFVAVTDDRVVGFISTAVNTVASRGCIIDLAVASECQGRGVGRRLIKRALAYFRKLDLHHAKIETLAVNQAGQHLYPAMGFIEVTRQIHYVMPLKKRGG